MRKPISYAVYYCVFALSFLVSEHNTSFVHAYSEPTLATFTVTNTNASGPGSLSEAVANANATTANDTITFNISGCPNNVCTINLTSGLTVLGTPGSGTLTISNPSGPNGLILNATGLFAIDVLVNGNLTLDGLTIANGVVAVHSFASGSSSVNITVRNCNIRNNQRAIDGTFTGLVNLGNITVEDSQITDQTQQGILCTACSVTIRRTVLRNNAKGAIYMQPAFGDHFGYLALESVQITGNAVPAGSQAAVFVQGSYVNIDASDISHNTGRGFYFLNTTSFGPSTFEIKNSTVSYNESPGNGAGLHLNTSSGYFFISNSVVSNNTVTSTGMGGGIFYSSNEGRLYVRNSTISRNSALASGSDGGGLATSRITLVNSTVSGNRAGRYGGGLWGTDWTLVNSTVTQNSSQAGGGIFITNNSKLLNSIVADNTAVAAQPDIFGYPSFPLTSLGNNLIGNSDTNVSISWLASDKLNVLPQLAPLRNYGGLTPTHALLPSSPAINAGNSCVLTAFGCPSGEPFVDLLADQRGRGRSGPVDIGSVEKQPVESYFSPFDYDGDGKTDFSVFRAPSGAWYLQRSTAGFQGLQFGGASDRLVPADYDGDGKTDIAVFRPAAGQWYILNSSNGTVSYPVFGAVGDLPAPGDYDGDGKADLTVFRPSQGQWYRTNSSNGSFFAFPFGANGDVPTVGDFDGDGKNDIGIWRPSNGDWYNLRSSNGSVFGERFGQTGDKIAPADYDGDGKTDIAIYRPSTGLWVVRNSATATYSYYVFGAADDVPVAGDYDGDGKADIGVWRPSDGTWYIQRSSNSQFIVFPWGQNGDRPTPSAYGN